MIINAHIAKLDNEMDVLFAGLMSVILAEISAVSPTSAVECVGRALVLTAMCS